MKNFKNTLGITLTSAILAAGLTVGASAQTLSGGTSCPINGSQNATSIISTCVSGSSKTASGSDLNSLLRNLTSNCPTGQASKSAANVQSASQGSSCPTAACKQANCAQTSPSLGNTLPSCAADLLKKCGIDPNSLCVTNSNCGKTTDSSSNSSGSDKTSTQTNGGNQTPSSGGQSDNASSSNQNSTSKTDNQNFEEQVVALVNKQRAANGLQPLTLSTSLSNAARAKSQDMHDKHYFAHESPTYGSPFDMLKSFGISYRSAGENIAMGYATPEAVMNAWMNSSGHRANILNASYTQIGVGYVADGNYWTQEFIG